MDDKGSSRYVENNEITSCSGITSTNYELTSYDNDVKIDNIFFLNE